MSRHDFDPATVTPDGRAAGKGAAVRRSVEGPYRGSVNGESLGRAGHRAHLWQ